MQRFTIRTVLLGFFLWSLSAQVYSQDQVNASVGIGSVRGDFLSDFLALEGLGPHVQASYLFKGKNSRFRFGPSASFTQNTQQRTTTYDSIPRVTSMQIQHYFVGAELKTYLASSAWIYNPYPGRILPYLGLGLGASFTNNTLRGDTPPPAFTIQEGLNVSGAANITLGIEVNLNKKASITASGTGRLGNSDFWDGMAGTGNAKDVLVSFQLGLTYRFLQDQVF
jgi:hypothetical protein